MIFLFQNLLRAGVRRCFALPMLSVSLLAQVAEGDTFTPSGPALAAGQTKFLGCAYSTAQAPNFTAYWNQVTPENAGKWGSVEATRDVMNWTELDNAYNFAKSNGLKFRFHILVWGSQQPAWISSLPTAEKLEEIKEWFAAVAARYPDIDYLEVVNEPLHAPPNGTTIAFSTTLAANYADALGGAGTSGWDWLLNAFRLARQYFPGKKLVLNEYGVTNDGSTMARYIQIINLLKAENLVDVVSFQAHSFSTKAASTATLSANLATLAATGLPIMVTEMDIDDTTAAPQLDDYKRIFPLFWEHPSVIGITLWGYRPGMWRAAQGANLVLADGTEKPAMLWLKSYVSDHPPVVVPQQIFRLSASATNGTSIGLVQASDVDLNTTFQNWQITGGTGATAFAIDAATGTLRLANASLLDFATTPSYTVTVTVGDGLRQSAAATVYVLAPQVDLLVLQAPVAQTLVAGKEASFSVLAFGSPTLAYQWQRSTDGGVNWQDLLENTTYVGTTTAGLTIKRTTLSMKGDRFRCLLSNGTSAALPSEAATLTVQWSQFAALSARAPVGTGDQTLILGFVFAGGGKPTMVRGVGPGLVKGDSNLAGQELVDPQLTLYELQTVNNVTQFVAIATNDNWGGTEELRTKMSALGMGVLDDTSTDAVMLTTPTRAVYTAQISGANQTTGLALAEVYDANFTDKAKRLTALSVRNQVGAGSSMLIAGLVVSGDAPKKVIIRGVGPGLLHDFPQLTGRELANPTLQVNKYDTTAKTWSVVGANDDWGGSAELATAMSQAGMGTLATDSKDAVLLIELQPGIYTAQVSGVGETTGIGLVEIYEAP